jgi:hypothetical protein
MHFFQICRDLNSYNFILENVSLRVPVRNVRGFSLFSVCPSVIHCPSVMRAYAANAVGKYLDIFVIENFSQSYFLIVYLKLLIFFL